MRRQPRGPWLAVALCSQWRCAQMADQDLLHRLEPLLDARSGVLSGMTKLVFPSGYMDQMHGFAATVGRASALHPRAVSVVPGELAGYGTALDETTARVRAVCEGLERYCSMLYPTSGVVVATARELGEYALDPRRLPQCSAQERGRAAPHLRLRLPDPDASERWVQGHSLTRARPVWVPMTGVCLGLPEPLTAHLAFPMSTGFAAGTDYESAILSALCEVIERDSLALWWLHHLPMPRIDIDRQADGNLLELLRRARHVGIRTHLFNLTTDVGVPVIGLLQTTERGRPHAVAIGACRPDGVAAAIRVVEEAGSLRIALSWGRTAAGRDAIFAGEAVSPKEFGLLYAEADGPSQFAFATRDAPTHTALPDPLRGSHPLTTIVERLATLGMEAIVVDFTLPEIRDFGLVVVRVIVPELMPISFSHSIRYLAHPRLYTAPRRLGYGERTEAMVTDDPIPFA